MDQIQATPDLDIDQNVTGAQIWGKLLSLNKIKLSSYEMRDKEVTIGRNKSCTFCVDDVRLSGVHCKILFDTENMIAKLTDMSTNGTFLGEQKIGKGNEIIIKTGDEIYILHKSKVIEQDVLGFAYFSTSQPEQKSSIIFQKETEDQIKNNEKMKKLDELGEDFNCPICDDLIFQAVTLMPCLHNFCGSCFSDWMVKQKTCPSCRHDVDVVKQNATINNVIGKFLDANPQKRRPVEEYKQMEDNNKINRDTIKFNGAKVVDTPAIVAPQQLVIKQPAQKQKIKQDPMTSKQQPVKTRNSKQDRQDYSAGSGSDNELAKDCLFCKKVLQGFQCEKNQKHVKCENCKRSFPDRQLSQAENEELHHKCQICNIVVCNLVNNQCKKNPRGIQLFLLKDMPQYGVNIGLFRNNGFEHQVVQDFMKKNKINPQTLLNNFIQQFVKNGQFRYVQNNKITTIPVGQPQVDTVLSPDTPICDRCGPQVWFQIVFRYRISIKNELPQEIKNRNVCWWGINCRTMSHNIDHAQTLDHMCEQTKQ